MEKTIYRQKNTHTINLCLLLFDLLTLIITVKVKADMQNDSQTDSNTTATSGNTNPQPPTLSGGQKVIQPTPELVQELQAQQQSPPATVSPAAPQPTKPSVPPQSVYPQPGSPADGQMQTGMSASQMGWSQSSNKSSFDIKSLIIEAVIGLVVIGVIFTALVFTNIIALSQFKTLGYTNSKGTRFQLTFYTKHGTKQLQSGNAQLVSKVSKDGKFPVALSISDGTDSGYARVKDCGSYTKVFDVQNNALNQTISVCDFGKQGNLPAGGVYVAGIAQNDKYYIVTIGQDYSGIDLSSQSGAQQSLSRFGLDSYQDDIKTIVSSIKVE